MAQELCFLKAVVLNCHGPDMSVFAFAMELFRRMCIFSFAGGYPVKHSCISAWFRNIFMCSSVLQMHTHVCLACDTYYWLDQVNGTLLMKAMKISSVVSWF